jgi:hypothetical protein
MTDYTEKELRLGEIIVEVDALHSEASRIVRSIEVNSFENVKFIIPLMVLQSVYNTCAILLRDQIERIEYYKMKPLRDRLKQAKKVNTDKP